MSDFHFIRPEWFFALIPLIWMLWQLNRQKLGNHGWQQIIPQHLVKHLMQGQNATLHQPFWLLAVIWLLVVIALAGPAWEKLPQPVYQTNTGKVLVMDMSQSMLATDLTPNRLTKARFKAIDLIDKIDDADMGLIAYSGDAFVISPLTADSKNLIALIPSLSPNIMPLVGSNAYAALDLADKLLKNAGYNRGEIYWITDGIDQSELNDIRQVLSASQHRVSILGVGTPQGAPIKQSSGELLKDGRGSIIIPKLNDSHLRSVAKATGGAYTRITSTAIDIDTLAQQELISREAKKEQDEQLHQGDQFREFGPIMVMLILPFAAYAFRRGLVFVFVLSSSLLISMPAPLQAANASSTPAITSAPSWWTNMWQTQDQQAAKQFDQQNYSDAAQMFDNNQWKGSSLYKSGDYEGALKAFEQNNDATGLYNQGSAHAKMQNFDEAIKAYEQALEQNPDMEDAKTNLDLIKQMQQQQEQQNQDGEGQDGEDQDQNQQNQDGQNNQNQDGEQGEQQEQDQQSQSEENQGEQEEQQNGQQGEQDDTQPREQNPQQGDQDPQAQQKEEPEEQSVPGEEQQEGEGEEKGEQQIKPSEEQTTEEKEQMQEIQQLIRKINDDPAVLLRNKMQLEYQKRKYQNSSPPGAKSW